MLRNTPLFVAAISVACGGSQKSAENAAAAESEVATTKETVEPRVLCYEGEYRIFNAHGALTANSLVAARYTIEPDRVVIEDVERGGQQTRDVLELDGDRVSTSSDGYAAQGSVEFVGNDVTIATQGVMGETTRTDTKTTLTEGFATEYWRVDVKDEATSAEWSTASHIVQALVRIPDDLCDRRFEVVASGERTTFARRGDELVAAAAGDTSGGEVDLKFAWPDDTVALVWADHSWNRNGTVTESRTPYILKLKSTDVGRAVFLDALYAPVLPDDSPQHLLASVKASDFLLYPFIVDANGSAVGIANYDMISTIARIGVRAQLPNDEAMEAIESAFEKPYMLQSVRKLWQPMVSAWHGATLKFGETYERTMRVSVPSPFGGSLEVDAEVEYAALGRVPCQRNADDNDCVLVQMTQSTDPAHVEQLLAGLYEKAAKDEEPPNVVSYDMSFTALTVLDPTTLRPFEYLELMKVEIGVEADGETATTRRVNAKALTFHYR